MVYYSEMPSYNSNNKNVKLNVNRFRFAKTKKIYFHLFVCFVNKYYTNQFKNKRVILCKTLKVG